MGIALLVLVLARIPAGTGPCQPGQGHRCNPAKLLLDPYAKAIDGQIDGDESLFGYRFDAPDAPNDTMDSLGHTMLSVVTDTAFDWGMTVPPIWPTTTHPAVPGAGAYSCAGPPQGNPGETAGMTSWNCLKSIRGGS